MHSRESLVELRQEASRYGRQWLGGGGGGRLGGGGAIRRGSVILQRQVLQSCFDPALVPQIQFIDRVDSVRDGVLLVLSAVVNRDRYPQLLSLSAVFGVLQHTDMVVDVPVDAVALWRLVKEFHIFSSCCSRCLLGIWTLFPRAPCLWQSPAPVRCDSPRRLFDEFLSVST